jgi:hypothetical protein
MRTATAWALACSLLCCGTAAAVPGTDEPAQIHVNAIRKPEIHKYKAVLAGLDSFEKHHALAPGVPELRFRVRPVGGRQIAAPAEPLRVRLEGDDDYRLALALDADHQFTVPRNETALDANSEVVLNQKRRDYRIMPHVRTPGLPDNVRRLGDLRLECKVMIAIAKEEISLMWVLAINGVLRTRDWCSFTMEEEKPKWGFDNDRTVLAATLREGERSEVLKTAENRFEVVLSDPSWSDDALITLEFALETRLVALEGPAGKPASTP